MAVPVWKRSVSSKEYIHFFKKLRKEIISLLYVDFGIKDEDKSKIPDWMIEDKRSEILKSLNSVSAYINRAMAVNLHTTDIEEKESLHKELLILQNRAIQECFVLYGILNDCIVDLPVKPNRLVILGHMIKEEVLYIKYWKKSFKKQDI